MRAWARSALLSLRALREAPVRTAITVGLVSFSCVVVSCTANLTLNMAADVRGLASSDSPDRALLLPKGARGWTGDDMAGIGEALASTATIEARRWTRVSFRFASGGQSSVRSVPLVCVSAAFPIERVLWFATTGLTLWGESPIDVIAPVIIGSALLPADTVLPSRISLQSSVGPLVAVGRLRPVPGVTFDARLNGALIVPMNAMDDRIRRLCQGRADELLVRARAADGIDRVVLQAEEAIRTARRLRPATATPLTVVSDDLVRRLVAQLAATIGPWIWMGPLAIALICGIGALAVNLVHGLDRIHEFGVMRSVGATRADLVRQMLAECGLVALLSAAFPLMSLLASALSTSGGEHALHALAAAGLGLALAALLSLVGVLLPGLYAARASRIASLERAGL